MTNGAFVPVPASSPCAWSSGDIVKAEGDIWRVGDPPEDLPGFIVVNRLFEPGQEVMDVPAGHCYPREHDLWKSFVRLSSAGDQYAIAMEARRAETGTGSVHDSAAIAQTSSSTATNNKDESE